MSFIRFRPVGLAFALLILPTGCADAQPTKGLAARAVAEARTMPPGRERDVTLREISRNLRHAARDQAIEAAAAMSEDYELRSFSPGPDKLTRQILAQQSEKDGEDRACVRFVEGLRPASATRADDQRIRDCFSMDAPPGIVAPLIPPFRLLLTAADALPPGRTKAELLYTATWDLVPDRPADGAREAVRRLRTLLRHLDSDLRREATQWLDTTSVDLIEGRPDDAIARVRQSLSRVQSTPDDLSADPVRQAQGLIADFLRAHDINRAVAVTTLLSPSNDCTVVDDGLRGVMEWVVLAQNDVSVAAYMQRLETSGAVARLCPNGLDQETIAGAWLTAGDDAKALAAAERTGSPLVLARTRVAVIDRRLQAGDKAGAQAMLRIAVADPVCVTSGSPMDRLGAARLRVRLIHNLAAFGDTAQAERLASGFPGPGWRGFAYSVIVATTNRDRAVPNWGGPFLDLSEVPADR